MTTVPRARRSERITLMVFVFKRPVKSWVPDECIYCEANTPGNIDGLGWDNLTFSSSAVPEPPSPMMGQIAVMGADGCASTQTGIDQGLTA